MSGGSRIRVLVVDDDPPVRISLVGYLEDCDFDVIAAGSAEEALELWRESPCDAAIIDMRLPGMNGESLVLEMHKASPTSLFLISTGSLDYEISKELAAIGLSEKHVFAKPLPDLDSLVECIKHCVS